MTLETAEPQEKSLDDLLAELPPIAGFWRRFVAFFVDGLILGIVGQALGWALSSFWFQVGPAGRLVGFVVILGYFGVMNSKLADGQTLGKRWLGIAVRDKNNKPISLGRSLLRISILAIPNTLNGWTLPILQNTVAMWLVSVIIFGVGGALVYTMVFNHKARQGLHDMICGTYVVHPSEKSIDHFPQTAQIHRIVAVGLIVLAVVLASVASLLTPSFMARFDLAQVNDLYQVLQTDSRFFSVGVNDNTINSSQGETTRYLQIQAWVKGRPTEDERVKIMNDIASVVLDSGTNIDQFDLIRVSITSSYDLGIASGRVTYSDGESLDVWRERVEQSRRP